jgi:hypothetical protein
MYIRTRTEHNFQCELVGFGSYVLAASVLLEQKERVKAGTWEETPMVTNLFWFEQRKLNKKWSDWFTPDGLTRLSPFRLPYQAVDWSVDLAFHMAPYYANGCMYQIDCDQVAVAADFNELKLPRLKVGVSGT